MTDTPIDKRFTILCEIVRAQHFAWYEAVRQLCPDVDPSAVLARMWEITGHQTAKAYLKHVDRSKALAPQIAAGIVWSSECMGEDAAVEIPEGAGGSDGSAKDEALVRHTDCPWYRWHQEQGLLEHDQPGCDLWFRTVIDDVNQALGTKLCVETLESLPAGRACCLRRLWVEA